MANSFFLSNNVKPLTLFSIILLVPFGIVHADHYGTVDTDIDNDVYYVADSDRTIDNHSRDFDFDGIDFDPIFEGDCKVTGDISLESNTESEYKLQMWIQEHDNTSEESSKWSWTKDRGVYSPDTKSFSINVCESGKTLDFDVDNSLAFEFDYCVNGNCNGNDKQDWFNNWELKVQEPRHCTWTDMPDSLNYGTVNNGDTGTATWNPSNNSTTYNADPTAVEFTIGNWINSTGSTVVDADNTSVNGTNTDNTDTIALSSVSANPTFAFSSTLNYITIGDLIRNIGESFRQTVTVTPVCS
ncbi:MAG: hypothetical protein IS860_10815 [Nitrosopumilus sp.]|nr:hypothetical protein [Nitrosopumilus sp.]